MKLLLLAGVTAATIFMGVAAAEAADMGVAAPDWNGLYGGVSLGYANVFGQIDDVGRNYANNAGFQDVAKATAFTFGGQIGYNFQASNNFVLGVEAGANGVFGEDAKCGAAGCSNYNNNGNPALAYNVNGLGSLNVRAGFLISDTTLLYATGGLAAASVVTHHWDSQEYDGKTRFMTGYDVGLGAEMKVSSSTSIRLEGRYYNLAAEHWTDGASEDFGAKPELFTISIGANYQF